MARSGDTDIQFDEGWFEKALRAPAVQQMTDNAAGRALAAAQASAPVDSGDYKRSLHIEHYNAKHRRTTRVVSDDDGALAIEARTGNLARAVKAAKQ